MVYEELMSMVCYRTHVGSKVTVLHKLKIQSQLKEETYEGSWIPSGLREVVGIHHLAWVNNLDAGAVVLIQRHED